MELPPRAEIERAVRATVLGLILGVAMAALAGRFAARRP